ncbi:MAG TPA: peptidylprolyl isomerase [Mycobacteriales bacterium]
MSRVGVVAGRDVPGALLDARLAELRAGPLAHALPPPDCLEGRRLRRWVAQLVLTEELVRAEAVRLGVTEPDPSPVGGGTGGAPGPLPPWAGSLAAAVLAAMPLARAVYRRVTDPIRVGQAEAENYYRRNPDLWQHPERRTLLHILTDRSDLSAQRPDQNLPDQDPPGRQPDPARLRADGVRWTCIESELPEQLGRLVFTAAPGDMVGPIITPFGWQLCLVEGVTSAHVVEFDTVRDEILTTLTLSARQRYFERWLEQRRRALVTVDPGCEHPGDPRHSDYAHHH